MLLRFLSALSLCVSLVAAVNWNANFDEDIANVVSASWWVPSIIRRIKRSEFRMQQTEEELMETVNRLRARVAQLEVEIGRHGSTAGVNNEQNDTETVIKRTGMPQSCLDLSNMGYRLAGFYNVKSRSRKKIETVYCDFTKGADSKGYEVRYGYNDIKREPVYFYVQKKERFSEQNVSVTFEIEVLNLGKAMNIKTGIFTAPRPGIYSFSISGIKDDVFGEMVVQLRLNGKILGLGYSDSDKTSLTFSLQATLRLKKGDQVSLALKSGVLYDDNDHYTHFTGQLLEEDVSFRP